MQIVTMWVSYSIDQISSFGRWPVPAGQLVVGEASSRYRDFESGGEGVVTLKTITTPYTVENESAFLLKTEVL